MSESKSEKKMRAESVFIQQLEHEVERIKQMVKKPKMIESKFEVVIGLHEGIERMVNEYIESSALKVRKEVEEVLKKWCSKFRTEWSTDIERIDELNAKIKYSSGKKNIKVPSWNEVVDKVMESVKGEFELFDESIYGEINEYVDVNVKKEDLENEDVREMIKNYNELKEEIENGLDDAVEEVRNVEKKWMKVRSKLEEKGRRWLEVLYICHLNYLIGVTKRTKCELTVNGKAIEGKQSDWLKGWLNEGGNGNDK